MNELFSAGAADRAITQERRFAERGFRSPNAATLRVQLPPDVHPSAPTIAASSTTSAFSSNFTDVTWNDARMREFGPPAIVAGTTSPNNGYGKAPTTESSWVREFVFDGDVIELKSKGQGSTTHQFHLWIDGQPISWTTAQGGDAPSDGNLYYTSVTFASKRPRLLRWHFASGKFVSGFRHDNADVIYESPAHAGPLIAFAGDSFTEGTNSGGPGMEWSGHCARAFGMRSAFSSGSGGTGYLNPGSGRVKLRDRIQTDVLQFVPDILVVAMGINDQTTYTQQQIATETTVLYQLVKATLPDCTLFVLGPWAPRASPGSGWTAVSNGIQTGLAAAGYSVSQSFIDTLATPAWITGSGKSGSTNGTGNADRFTSSDGTHPTPDGHRHLGYRTAVNMALKAPSVLSAVTGDNAQYATIVSGPNRYQIGT